ncbi:hypothetical protein N7541_000710 [Penicillium brevicompactum]|uniref:Uncharacterized protein n=1 Tax=Penicillium brevicompactum TaxID=5074 RepID=A0A9W9RXA4_PENBR|nr:hypothetical protein N7541_000710 [Penicillium brevicompactum]
MTIMEQRRAPEIALEKLRRIMSRIFHDNEPQMTLPINRIAPIGKILEGARESIQVFICAREGVDIAEPNQVAGATITPSLQLAHTTSIASICSVLEPHDRNDVATQVLLEIFLWCPALASSAGKLVESVSPGIVILAFFDRGIVV